MFVVTDLLGLTRSSHSACSANGETDAKNLAMLADDRLKWSEEHRSGPFLGPIPGMQVGAPGQTDAGEVIKAAARIFLTILRPVKEHEVISYAGDVPRIEHEASGNASMSPRPVFLSQGEEAGVLPVFKVGGTLDADAISRRVEHDILISADHDTHVFAATDGTGEGPVPEIARP